MLALADKHGEVMASVPGLAKVAGLSLESTMAALTKFMSPDPYSRTPDEEGRRIEVIDGGWLIINYAKHRRMASLDEQREKAAERQRRFRERKIANSNAQSRKVTKQSRTSNGVVTLETDKAEAEADTEKPLSGFKGVDLPESLNAPEFLQMWREWIAHRKEKGKPINERSAKMQLKACDEAGMVRSLIGIRDSIANGYQGLVMPKEWQVPKSSELKKQPRLV